MDNGRDVCYCPPSNNGGDTPPFVSQGLDLLMCASRRVLLLVLFACLSGIACFTPSRQRPCLPAQLTFASKLIDLNAPITYKPEDPRAIESIAHLIQNGNPAIVPANYQPAQKNLLAISGGGMYGSFSVGVLKGWSDAGTRPIFDVVTGVSTGALIGTFAFLGSEYDERLTKFYTQVKSADIFRTRARISLLWTDSYASSEPLKKLIEASITPELLQEVGRQHALGRRLYVGTTNLDTRRFVIWDMGAIASRGDQASLQLYRTVLLASSSVPGFFPPVEIDVEINGQKYTELHADGGATSEVFIRPGDYNLDPEAIKKGHRPLTGHNLYVITSGKYYADPKCVKRSLSGIASGTVAALLYAKTRDDLLRMYTLCLVTGMKFHVTALPQDFPIGPDSLDFNPIEMKRLFEEGYRIGKSGDKWRSLPPGTDPDEQVMPRTGVQFALPQEK